MDRDNIEEILKKLGSEAVPADVQKIAEETTRDFIGTQTKQPRHYVLWENIVRSRIIKLAAAAVIVIVVVLGVSQFFGGTVTFAEVIKPILNARTVVFDFVIGKEETGVVVHDVVAGSRIRRTFSNMDAIQILDLDNAKMLSLNPKSKGAMYLDIGGMVQEGTKDILGIVRNMVNDIEKHPDWPVQELGQQEIDGRKAIGFQVLRKNEEIAIWADPVTAKPVRIEMLFGEMSPVIIKNIDFDVPVDESLVSMEPPEGYTLASMEYNLNQFTEDDFVQSLRIWAELLRDGTFPETISSEDYMKMVPMFSEKLGKLNLSQEEGTRIGMTFGRGIMFFQVVAVNGCDFHYAGGGVKLGEADKAIFWYQPKGSKTYRVIYGDLHVEDVQADQLPG